MTARAIRRVVVAAALVVVAWLVVGAVQLWLARRDVGSGIDALDAARRAATADGVTTGAPLPHLDRARRQFEDAHARLGGAAVLALRVLPVSNRQVASARSLTGTAATLTDVARDALGAAKGDLGAVPKASARVEIAAHLAATAATARDRLARVDLGPRRGLVAPLARARNDLADQLERARLDAARAATAGQALAKVLAGPQRYLVVAANNAEMRAGSGMFLSLGVLEIAGGSLSLADMRPVKDVVVPAGTVAVERDVAARWGWMQPDVEWRNLMASPRFPASAEMAAAMWAAATGTGVDGVLAVDAIGLRALVRVTGAVEVDGVRVTPRNVVEYVLHDQYVAYPKDLDRPERRDRLGAITAAAVARLDGGDWQPARLLRQLADARAGRHVLAWARDDGVQAAWDDLAVNGDVTPKSVFVSVLNRGANKLDQFLDVAAEASVERTGHGARLTIRAHLTNGTPDGEPRYIAGPNEGGAAEREYVGIVAFTFPGDVERAWLDGFGTVSAEGRDGPTYVVATPLVHLAPGRTVDVVAHADLPHEHGDVRIEPSARFRAIRWRAGDVMWQDDHAVSVRW